MSNELDIFTSAEFGTLRTIEENGKIMFVASDVATMLGYSNPRKAIIDHCKGVTKRDTPTNGGIRQLTLFQRGIYIASLLIPNSLLLKNLKAGCLMKYYLAFARTVPISPHRL